MQATQWTRRSGDASAGYASNGVEFVEGKCASTPVSDGISSISQCFSPDGLRRSAFNSTPFGVKPAEAKKSSIATL